MTALFLFVIVWAAGSLVQSAARKIRRSTKANHRPRRAATEPPQMPTAPAATVKPKPDNVAAMAACEAQISELLEQLETIAAILDNAPPERERLRWMKERARIYGQIATAEARKTRLMA